MQSKNFTVKWALHCFLCIVFFSMMELSSAFAQTSGENIEIKDAVLPDNIQDVHCTTNISEQPWDALVLRSVNNINCHFVPLVGDIDNDGNVEIVAGKAVTNGYYDHFTTQVGIYRGTDLQQICIINVPQKIYAGCAGPMTLVRYPNGNGGLQGAIVLHCYDYKLRSYDINGQLLATSDINTPCEGTISVTDFNYDGYPEIYIGNAVYDAATLKQLCAGPANGNMGRSWHWDGTRGRCSMSFAADVLGDSIPELICGNTIYKVNIVSRTNVSLNSVTELKTIVVPSYMPQDGNVAVADFNFDGQLDVMVSIIAGTQNQIIEMAYIYTYDPVSEEILFIHTKSAKAIGYPMVGDIDGDKWLEFIYLDRQTNVSDSRITAMKYTPTTGLQTLWRATHTDVSAQTSMTLFDFNQDGKMEIVYRDESNLRIINGSGKSHITGNDTIPFYNLFTKSMSAGTYKEYPMVADVDNDGHAEIVTCGIISTGPGIIGGQLVVLGGIHPWAPARPVWNQYLYNVTNINMDLTVPIPLFNNGTIFIDPENEMRWPFNNFLQQATTLDQYGRPFVAATDVAISNAELQNEDDGVTVTFDYCNQGDKTLFAPYHITAFADHFGGNVLASVSVNEELVVGDCTQGSIHFPAGALCGTPNLDSIAIIVNCTSNGIAQNGGLQPECDISNNTAVVFSAIFNDTTYLTTSACNQFEWFGETLTQSGDYYHTFTNGFGCDSLVVLNLTIRPTETTHETAAACNEYEWKGNTYYQSGTYEHYEGHTINGCDSIAVLDLTIHNAPPIEILGYTQVAFSSDLWHGIYHYYVIDSTNYEPNAITWSCSNPDWILFPITDFHCLLIAKSQGTAVLMANAVTNMGCNTSASIEINASNYGIGDEEETSVMLFPNPAQTQVTVQAHGLSHIKLFNVFGQVVKEVPIEQADAATINIDNLSQGIFMVEITTIYGRIIKQLMISR